jgi:hypothetical protein
MTAAGSGGAAVAGRDGGASAAPVRRAFAPRPSVSVPSGEMSSHGYNVPPAYFPPRPPQMPPGGGPPQPPGRRRRGGLPAWAWVLIVLGALVLLSCAGLFAFVAYVGSAGPGTRVYTANEVPRKYVDLSTQLGLLDPGEKVRFFYSDALTDVRGGMYMVTDKKVVVYIEDAQTPATIVPFGRIEEATLDASDSDWVDGTITLVLADGSAVTFPVSAEGGRDKLMFDAIEAGRAAAGPEGPE